MRHFPLTTVILCVLLPPLVYAFSVQSLEKLVQAHYAKQWVQVYTGDPQRLFAGSIRLQDAILENTDAFLSSRKLPQWGARLWVTVKSPDGTLLYPGAYDTLPPKWDEADSLAIARENFRLLNEGLICRFDVKIAHNTLISNLVLAFYVSLALLVLIGAYRRWVVRSRVEALAKQEMINDLTNAQQEGLAQLERLEAQRNRLDDQIKAMQTQRLQEQQAATDAEDQLIDELVALEEKISTQVKRHDFQSQEINVLKRKIQEYEKADANPGRLPHKTTDGIRKRFNTLYKDTTIHDRAIAGFVSLTEEMKIKAEAVVHQLNANPTLVSIKRKVFCKKSRQAVFEVIFGYRGRLYFRATNGNRVEVVVIGTKLSQTKDLAFLDKL